MLPSFVFATTPTRIPDMTRAGRVGAVGRRRDEHDNQRHPGPNPAGDRPNHHQTRILTLRAEFGWQAETARKAGNSHKSPLDLRKTCLVPLICSTGTKGCGVENSGHVIWQHLGGRVERSSCTIRAGESSTCRALLSLPLEAPEVPHNLGLRVML